MKAISLSLLRLIVAVVCFLAAFAMPVFAQTSEGDALSAKVDEIVRDQIREQKLPGVALAVVRDGKIVKAAGYGLANVELNVPVTPRSLFHTESIAKTFTATAVMMLVEEGKVGLDDRISKYLPQAPAARRHHPPSAFTHFRHSRLLWRRWRHETRFSSGFH